MTSISYLNNEVVLTVYTCSIRTLAVLEGQRMIAVQNMEKIIPLKKEALESPLTFIEKLQRGGNMDFPLPQVIAEVSYT